MLQYLDDFKLYFLILFTGIFVYLWKHARVFYYGSKFDGPFAWPIFGNVLAFAGKTEIVHEVVAKWLDRYKSPMRAYVGNRLYVLISKPEHLQIVLNSPYALGKGDFYDYAKVAVGEGLATAPVHKWKRTRKLMLPVFNIRNLTEYVEIFSRRAGLLTKKLECRVGEKYFDVFPEIYLATLGMICETSLGVKLEDHPEGRNYWKYLDKGSYIVNQRMVNVFWSFDIFFKLSRWSKKLNTYVKKVRDFSNSVILEKQNYMKSKNLDDFDCTPTRKSFVDRILKLAEEEIELFSNKQILDEITTISITGSETSAATSAFVLVMLGMHQDIQEKVYEELQFVFKDDDRPFVHEDLTQLPLLERVIKETLRLFPIVPIFFRKVVQDIDLGSHILPKDSVCLFPSYYTQRDPKLWDDPLKFDPDRFLPENVAKRHPCSYLPFSLGPRNCIGLTYAMYSMKTILSTILRKYQVYTTYKSVEDVEFRVAMSMKALNGHMITLKTRTKQS